MNNPAQPLSALGLREIENLNLDMCDDDELDAARNRCRYQYELIANKDLTTLGQRRTMNAWSAQSTRIKRELRHRKESRQDISHAKQMGGMFRSAAE